VREAVLGGYRKGSVGMGMRVDSGGVIGDGVIREGVACGWLGWGVVQLRVGGVVVIQHTLHYQMAARTHHTLHINSNCNILRIHAYN
jgi:hypothetical protein